MDAVVLAGGTPKPESPLYPQTLGKPKALLDIGGQPMIQWVLDALEAASSIDRIIIVGCEDQEGKLRSSKIAGYRPSAGDIIANFRVGAGAVLEGNPAAAYIALIASDIPLVTAESIDWIVDSSLDTNLDLYYSVIEQSQMESRFPESSRSYVKLKDMNVCGGDLNIISLDLYRSRDDLWRKIVEARKNYLRQAALVGFDILFLLLIRQLSLAGAVKKVTRRLKITGTGLVCPYPEIGMDIDKPHQLEIARSELTQPTL